MTALLSSILLGLAVSLGYAVLLRGLDRLDSGYEADLRDRMTRMGMSTRFLVFALRLRWIQIALTIIGFWIAGMLPVGLFLAWLDWKLIAILLEYRIKVWRQQLRDQLVSATRALTSQVRAGLPLGKSLASVAEEFPEPLGIHLRATSYRYEKGLPFVQSLEELKDRLQMDEISLLVIALSVAQARGGDIAETLERIGRSLEEIQRVERKKDTDTAAGRLLVLVLALFPPGFLGMFWFLDPEGTSLVFSLLAGQVVLVVVGVIVYVAVRWAQRILAQIE